LADKPAEQSEMELKFLAGVLPKQFAHACFVDHSGLL